MSDRDLMQLYSTRLLQLTTEIPHLGRLPAPGGRASRRAPQCGSEVAVEVVLQQGRITAFAQEVRACALGQAAAALLGQVVIGLSSADLRLGRDGLAAMLAGGAPPAPPFQGYEVLTAARPFRNRHASILLAIEAALEATEQAEAMGPDTTAPNTTGTDTPVSPP